METSEMVECGACCEDFGLPEIVVIDSTPVCHGCLRHVFTNATEDESNYPPRWGDQELKIDNYKHILDGELVKRYRKKAHEYKKKWDDRVYCPTEKEGVKCGEYLGGRRSKETHIRLTATCKKCSNKTCLACRAQPSSRSGHVCDASSEEQEQEAASFKGLTKGKDWQKCPNCKRNIELQDGCNHVVCTCGMSLCFVCGQPAKGNSNHWSSAMGTTTTCPRYHHPTDSNAMWEDNVGQAAREPLWEADLFGAAFDGPPTPTEDVNRMLDQFRAARRNAVAGPLVDHRAGLMQRLALGRNSVSSAAATAAGTTARRRRLGGRLQEHAGTSNDPIDLETPMPPPAGDTVLHRSQHDGSTARRRNRRSSGRRQGHVDTGAAISVSPVDRIMFTNIFATVPTAHQQAGEEATISRREDALAQMLASLPPDETLEARLRRRRVSNQAPVLQAPQIPERISSLQQSSGTFNSNNIRAARPTRREPSLNFNFQFPQGQDALGDTVMQDR